MATDVNETQTQQPPTERLRGGPVFRPLVDILETPEELTLVADLPGVKSEDVDIHFEDGVLTIQGKVERSYGEGAKLLLNEYGIGDFQRSFRVSEAIDPARIHAECGAGVLTVHLPKAEAAKPRKIAVQAR
jgi:HSP20 family molecular chaperone IbpA